MMKKIIFIFLLLIIVGCGQQAVKEEIIDVPSDTNVQEVPVVSDPLPKADDISQPETVEEPIIEPVDESMESAKPDSVPQDLMITMEEFRKHNTEEDCWVFYKHKVYDYSSAPKHPNMPKTIYSHCGELTFEYSAKQQHSGSNENRVANYGTVLGFLE